MFGMFDENGFFVTIADYKKELIDSGPLDLLKFIFEPKLEGGLPNTVIMLKMFLTAAINNASAEKSFFKSIIQVLQ